MNSLEVPYSRSFHSALRLELTQLEPVRIYSLLTYARAFTLIAGELSLNLRIYTNSTNDGKSGSVAKIVS